MENKVVIIIGSSRKDGDTKKLIEKVCTFQNFDIIYLNDYQFSYYDYEHKNERDDYLSLMQNIIEKYDTFLLATPVYWYAMSGIMKVFFDRITDLLDIKIELGRKLRNKKMAVITCSIGNNLGDSFWLPFIETANYLGIKYLGNLHTINDNINEKELRIFIEQITKK